MKFTVIGASAGIGLETVKELCARGHAVTTLSRSVASIPQDAHITRIQGSALNADDVAKAIEGAQAILVTLGTGTDTKATGLYPKAASVLLQALKAGAARPPLIVLTGFGAGDSWDYNSVPMKILFRLFLKDIYAEKTLMEKMVAEEYPNAMFVRPGRLTNGEQRRQYRVISALNHSTKVGAIARKDVAHFLASQAENPTYLGQYPALSY